MFFAFDECDNMRKGEECDAAVPDWKNADDVPDPDAVDDPDTSETEDAPSETGAETHPEPGVSGPTGTDEGVSGPTGTDEGASDTATAPAAKKKGFKALLRKWWFWLIVGLVVAGIGTGITVAVVSSGSSSSSYSSGISESPFVTLVKTTTNSNYGITYGAAFDSFFSSPRWRYFLSDGGANVVEFTGKFSYADAPATALIQFVVDLDEGSITASYLEINGIAQNRLLLATLIGKVFSSY